MRSSEVIKFLDASNLDKLELLASSSVLLSRCQCERASFAVVSANGICLAKLAASEALATPLLETIELDANVYGRFVRFSRSHTDSTVAKADGGSLCLT